jgi:hypothetical protein
VITCNMKIKKIHYVHWLPDHNFSFHFNKKCCSGRLVLPPARTFSSSQHVFDQIWSFTSW